MTSYLDEARWLTLSRLSIKVISYSSRSQEKKNVSNVVGTISGKEFLVENPF